MLGLKAQRLRLVGPISSASVEALMMDTVTSLQDQGQRLTSQTTN